MTIQCYTIDCDKKYVNKDWFFDSENPELTLTGVRFIENVDIMNIELIVDYNEKLFDCNYVHIGTLHRFYYIKDIVTMENRLKLILSEDLLMSFMSCLENMGGIICRNRDDWDLYLNDKVFKLENYNETYMLDFPHSHQFFDKGNCSFVLAVAGPKGGTGA